MRADGNERVGDTYIGMDDLVKPPLHLAMWD